jgi:hypothetical protein
MLGIRASVVMAKMWDIALIKGFLREIQRMVEMELSLDISGTVRPVCLTPH